jgi:hypothetical protein
MDCQNCRNFNTDRSTHAYLYPCAVRPGFTGEECADYEFVERAEPVFPVFSIDTRSPEDFFGNRQVSIVPIERLDWRTLAIRGLSPSRLEISGGIDGIPRVTLDDRTITRDEYLSMSGYFERDADNWLDTELRGIWNLPPRSAPSRNGCPPFHYLQAEFFDGDRVFRWLESRDGRLIEGDRPMSTIGYRGLDTSYVPLYEEVNTLQGTRVVKTRPDSWFSPEDLAAWDDFARSRERVQIPPAIASDSDRYREMIRQMREFRPIAPSLDTERVDRSYRRLMIDREERYRSESDRELIQQMSSISAPSYPSEEAVIEFNRPAVGGSIDRDRERWYRERWYRSESDRTSSAPFRPREIETHLPEENAFSRIDFLPRPFAAPALVEKLRGSIEEIGRSVHRIVSGFLSSGLTAEEFNEVLRRSMGYVVTVKLPDYRPKRTKRRNRYRDR